MRELLDRMLSPIRRRLRLIISRAVVTASDDEARLQSLSLDLYADEHRAAVPRLQQYGLSSRPKDGAEVLVASVGGDRAQMVAVACDDRRDRPTGLEPGEVCLWVPDSGKRIHCRSDGHVDLGSEPEDYVALSKLVKSELDALKSDLDTLKQWAGTHTHTCASPGSPTTAVAPPLILSWSPGSVAAEEVRAK